MRYKTKRRVSEVFCIGIPYTVEAKPFVSGMETGYKAVVNESGNNYYISRNLLKNADKNLRKNYTIVDKMVMTVFGAVTVYDGDFIVKTPDDGIFVVRRDIFEEWYEKCEEEYFDEKEKHT